MAVAVLNCPTVAVTAFAVILKHAVAQTILALFTDRLKIFRQIIKTWEEHITNAHKKMYGPSLITSTPRAHVYVCVCVCVCARARVI